MANPFMMMFLLVLSVVSEIVLAEPEVCLNALILRSNCKSAEELTDDENTLIWFRQKLNRKFRFLLTKSALTQVFQMIHR